MFYWKCSRGIRMIPRVKTRLVAPDRMFNPPTPTDQKEHDMIFEKEMEMFFSRNCYREEEREEVKASPAYRQAAEMNDVIQAQETATRILEARPRRVW